MFRVENNVPDVYRNESRDFQLFSRLYDLVFQSARFSIQSMTQLSDTMSCNDAVLPLLATKVGFFTDLKLTSRADRLILSAFPYILRYKGSVEGIRLTANLFGRICNTSVGIKEDPLDKNHLTIEFSNNASNFDMSILYSLLNYIRPTGVFIDHQIITYTNTSSDYGVADVVKLTSFTADNRVCKGTSADKYTNNVGFTLVSTKERISTEIDQGGKSS